ATGPQHRVGPAGSARPQDRPPEDQYRSDRRREADRGAGAGFGSGEGAPAGSAVREPDRRAQPAAAPDHGVGDAVLSGADRDRGGRGGGYSSEPGGGGGQGVGGGAGSAAQGLEPGPGGCQDRRGVRPG